MLANEGLAMGSSGLGESTIFSIFSQHLQTLNYQEMPNNTDSPQTEVEKKPIVPSPPVFSFDISQEWETPTWFNQDENSKSPSTRSYLKYLLFELRSRYLDLEGDFRTFYWEDPERASKTTAFPRVQNLLKVAKEGLEKEQPANLLEIAAVLDLVERYMVWVYPSNYFLVRASLMYEKLNKEGDVHAPQLKACLDEGNLSKIASAMDEIIGDRNERILQEKISSGLQIRRLKVLRLFGLMILGIFLLATPFVAKNITALWKDGFVITIWQNLNQSLLPWLFSLGIILIGAFGGFFSGLLQVRSTKVNLLQFEESLLKFQLKPILGGVLASLAFILLSWDIVPGITLTHAGSFIFIAFMSGFSERYLLNLLEINPEDQQEPQMSTSTLPPETKAIQE